MSQPIIPKHARIGVCAICNHNGWVVPEEYFSGRNICVDTVECGSNTQFAHDTAVRADLITEIKTLCDEHLLSSWGFVRAEGTQKWAGECARCAEEMAEEMAWERSGFTPDEF